MSFWNIFNKDKIISLNVDQDISNYPVSPVTYLDLDTQEPKKEEVIGQNNYLVEYDLKDRLNPDLWIKRSTGEAFTEDDIMRSDGDKNSLSTSADLVIPTLAWIDFFDQDGIYNENHHTVGFGVSLEKFEIKVMNKGILINSFKLLLTVDVIEPVYDTDGYFRDLLDASIVDLKTNREYVSTIIFTFYLEHLQNTEDYLHNTEDPLHILNAEVMPTKITRLT